MEEGHELTFSDKILADKSVGLKYYWRSMFIGIYYLFYGKELYLPSYSERCFDVSVASRKLFRAAAPPHIDCGVAHATCDVTQGRTYL